MSNSPVRALFLQQHLGVLSFLIFGGKDHGKQVFARVRDEQWHRDARRRGQFDQHSDAGFEANVIGEVGLVTDGNRGVHLDTINAVWSTTNEVVLDKSSLVRSLGTGFNSPELGWIRSNVETLPLPVVQELGWDELDELTASLFPNGMQARSLALRDKALAMS